MIAEIPYSFEEMQWKDVPVVMAIEHRSFTLPWSASTYRHEILDNPNGHYFVLRQRAGGPARWTDWWSRLTHRETDGPIVGYGGFWLIADEAHISTIAVDIGWRGRGLGEYLLVSLIERAIALKAASITLEVREGNRVAQNLYRKYGFVVTGHRQRYYQDNHENALLMAVEGVNGDSYRQSFSRLTAALSARLAQINTQFASS